MFKKIVSNLPFSPSLVGHLSHFSKKIKEEEKKRRTALFFIASTLLLQLFIPFQPAASTDKTDNQSPTESSQYNVDISKSAVGTNLSQGFVEASSVTAHGGDQISYTITIQNISSKLIVYDFTLPLADALEYSTITDAGGGSLDKSTNQITWGNVTISPNSILTRTISIKILDPIPATAHSSNKPKSHDCIASVIFGNDVNINVECPALKQVENIMSSLPIINQRNNLIFTFSILFISVFMYLRTRLLEKEIRLIRKDANSGSIY
ncbi:MAG: hypothetical protein WA087_02065 [Candidatus Saccharimonadales bacterium]